MVESYNVKHDYKNLELTECQFHISFQFDFRFWLMSSNGIFILNRNHLQIESLVNDIKTSIDEHRQKCRRDVNI